MLFVIIGMLIGLAVTIGPLRFAAAPFDTVAAHLVDFAAALTAEVTGEPATTWAAAVTVFNALIVPGLVAVTLACLASGSRHIVTLATILLLAGAGFAFTLLPTGSAVLLAALALVAVVWVRFAHGLFVQAPLISVATVICVRHLTSVFDPASTLNEMIGDLAVLAEVPVTFLNIAATVVAVAPFTGAVMVATRQSK